MARVDTLPHFLTDVADAIRTKKGTSETIKASDFDTEIENLPSGGGGLDWSAIGYNGTPQVIKDGYDYAVEIKNNWVSTSSLRNKFKNDLNLKIMPLVDTSNATNMYGMFENTRGLTQIPLLDTSNVTDMSRMFFESVISTIPLLDTSKVTDMSYMFTKVSSLTTIPLLNTSKVTNMDSMFSSAGNLTDESLDNILQMCINATSYKRTKTLYQLSFRKTYYPASRIQALPHYQDFLDAGWTIGY